MSPTIWAWGSGGVPELNLRYLGILGPAGRRPLAHVPIGEGVSVLWRARAVAY
jgi:hypothetical protein